MSGLEDYFNKPLEGFYDVQDFHSKDQIKCYNNCYNGYPLDIFDFQFPNRRFYDECIVNCDQAEYRTKAPTGTPHSYMAMPQKLNVCNPPIPIEGFAGSSIVWVGLILVLIWMCMKKMN